MIFVFTWLLTTLSSYLHNMAIFCLLKNCIFDNSNFTRAHIAQSAEHFHGKEEVFGSTPNVGTRSNYLLKKNFLRKKPKIKIRKNPPIGK